MDLLGEHLTEDGGKIGGREDSLRERIRYDGPLCGPSIETPDIKSDRFTCIVFQKPGNFTPN